MDNGRFVYDCLIEPTSLILLTPVVDTFKIFKSECVQV